MQNGILRPRVAPQAAPFALAAGSGAASGEVVGRSIQQAGAALQGLGQDIDRKVEADNTAWASRALAEARSKWTLDFEERQKNAEPGAANFSSTIEEDFQAFREGLVAKAGHKTAADFLDQRLGEFGASLASDARRFEDRESVRYRVSQITDAVNISANTLANDPSQFDAVLGEITASIDAFDLPPVAAAEATKEARETLAESALQGLITRAPGAAMKSLKNGEWDGHIQPARKQVLIRAALAQSRSNEAHARAERNRVEAAAEEAKRKERDALFGSLDLAAARDELTPEMVDATDLPDKDKATLLRRIDSADKSRANVERVSGVVGTDETLNGFNSDDRKAVEDYTSFVTDALTEQAEATGAEPPPPADVAASVAMRTGVAPPQLVQETRRALHSGDGEQAATALARAAQVIETHPGAFAGQSGAEEIEKQVSRFQAAIDLQYDPAAAVEFARGADSPFASEAVREARKRFDGREQQRGQAPKITEADLVDRFDSWFLGDRPGFRDERLQALRVDGQRIFEIEYQNANGVEEVAREATLNQLARIWGPSDVTGSREVMKFAPEMVYPAVAGSYDYIGEQVQETLADASAAPGYGGGDFFLMSNERTARDVASGRAPGYTLLYAKDDDTVEAVIGDFYADPDAARSKILDAEKARRAEIERNSDGRSRGARRRGSR